MQYVISHIVSYKNSTTEVYNVILSNLCNVVKKIVYNISCYSKFNLGEQMREKINKNTTIYVRFTCTIVVVIHSVHHRHVLI